MDPELRDGGLSLNLSTGAHKLALKVFWVLRKINERLQPLIRYTLWRQKSLLFT